MNATKNKDAYFLVGGAGYIGKTVYHALKESDSGKISVYDNLSTGNIRTLTYEDNVYLGEASDRQRMKQALEAELSTSDNLTVMMFAGSKSVAESTHNPYLYYQNNVGSLLSVLGVMKELGLYKIVFSSSATVYGQPRHLPIMEEHPLSGLSPYGRSKFMCEQILRDLAASDPKWKVGILRYFNPVGAWPEKEHGETPKDIPYNLVPFMAQVASGKREKLKVYGNDYNTIDGTGVRDYLHVRDLADAHVQMARYLDTGKDTCTTLNLGVGKGFSVLEVLKAFEQVSGKRIPYDIVGRRPGDADAVYCDPSKARELLGWSANRTLIEMCESEWQWQLQQK